MQGGVRSDREHEIYCDRGIFSRLLRKEQKTVETGLTTKYCEDLWDKLVYCPYEMSLTN